MARYENNLFHPSPYPEARSVQITVIPGGGRNPLDCGGSQSGAVLSAPKTCSVQSPKQRTRWLGVMNTATKGKCQDLGDPSYLSHTHTPSNSALLSPSVPWARDLTGEPAPYPHAGRQGHWLGAFPFSVTGQDNLELPSSARLLPSFPETRAQMLIQLDN